MRRSARLVGAIVAGSAVAVVLAWLGAVIIVLSTMGIPLGSTGRAPSPGEYALLLLSGGVAAAAGGGVARAVAVPGERAAAPAVAAVLAAGYLWGFSRPASHWPAWWGPALAAVAAAAVVAGARVYREDRGKRSPASRGSP